MRAIVPHLNPMASLYGEMEGLLLAFGGGGRG